MARSLIERLTEYRDGTAALLTNAEFLTKDIPDSEKAQLTTAIEVYRVMIDDLTKIIDGEELEMRVMEVEV